MNAKQLAMKLSAEFGAWDSLPVVYESDGQIRWVRSAGTVELICDNGEWRVPINSNDRPDFARIRVVVLGD